MRVDNSTLGVTGHIELATYGTAEMIVSNGSALSSYSLRIAADSGSSGSLTLSNSTWVNGSHAEIGAGGVGILSLTQGATGEMTKAAFDTNGKGAIVSASRSILYPKSTGGDWREAIESAVHAMRTDLEQFTKA